MRLLSVRTAAFSAGRWTAVSAAVVACSQMAQVVALARLLSPADFGLMAVAAAVVAVLLLFVDFGLSRALIHFGSIPEQILSSLYWINMVMAFMFMTLLMCVAPLIGVLYQEPQLVGVLQVASLIFPLTAAGQQFRVLAEKELRFRSLALIEMVSAVAGFVAALGIALVGGGVYALVAGALFSVTVSSGLAWFFLSKGCRPGFRLSVRDTKPYIKFGAYMVGENAASTLHRQADIFIAGRMAGAASVAFFALPRELSFRIASLINPIITRVGFPIMARIRGEPERLRAVYGHTLRMTASINFPIYVALGVFADEIVALIYGPKWDEAIQYLRILAMWGLARSTSNPVGSLLYAVGKAKRAFWWNLILLLILPLIYWVSLKNWGLPGMAISMAIMQCVCVVPVWACLVRPSCQMSLRAYLQALTVPLLLSAFAGLSAWLIALNVEAGVLRLAIGMLVGASVYAALSWVFNRDWVEAMLGVFRSRRVDPV